MSAEVLRVVAMRKLRKLSSFDTRMSSSSEISLFVISRLVIQEQSGLGEQTVAISIDGRDKGRRTCRRDV